LGVWNFCFHFELRKDVMKAAAENDRQVRPQFGKGPDFCGSFCGVRAPSTAAESPIPCFMYVRHVF